MGWDAAFILMLAACVLAILFTSFTWNIEKRRLLADN
jgi:OPA family glycerol-3-phosphate transporter-like MFS transporter